MPPSARVVDGSRGDLLMVGVIAMVLGAGCASGWRASPRTVDPRLVAEALGDPPPRARDLAATLPVLAPPSHARPCCVFGMDLRAGIGDVEVPFLEIENVISADDLGEHAYALAMGEPEVEGNGLVYTCRGGFIDTGHARENADYQLFLSVSIARSLARGTTLVVPWHGAETTLVIDPVPDAILSEHDPLELAATLAAWATFRISIWHEVASWFGLQSISGVSEQISSFSPEDLYSNALGIRLATAALEADELTTEEEYGLAIVGLLHAALVRLDAQPPEVGREILRALDGRWWDSSRHVPEVQLVTHRVLPRDGPIVTPRRAEDAFEDGAVPDVLTRSCGDARTRPLRIADHVGDTRVSDLVHITWRPEGWADERLAFPDPATRVITNDDLDTLVARTRDELREVLGADFDRPRGAERRESSARD